jgi:hypothetical protein
MMNYKECGRKCGVAYFKVLSHNLHLSSEKKTWFPGNFDFGRNCGNLFVRHAVRVGAGYLSVSQVTTHDDALQAALTAQQGHK